MPFSERRTRLKNDSAPFVQAPFNEYASWWLIRFIGKRAASLSQCPRLVSVNDRTRCDVLASERHAVSF